MVPGTKTRLDQRLVELELVVSRSQAESYIKLGEVTVNGKVVTKPGFLVQESAQLHVTAAQQYVSRAALKLASVVSELQLDFTGKTVLDVCSSTDYVLRHGAAAVIAVEVGTDQLHPILRGDSRISLHEKTDIRDVWLRGGAPVSVSPAVILDIPPDVVVADVSFISLREILPVIARLSSPRTEIIVMLKPQFEAGHSQVKHNGVIKNDRLRREILKDFETWARQYFVIRSKADSAVAGAKGNRERFYLLRKILPARSA
jgi:23S rRNA (cytidine1920-2'-O)/16S rRNA (cytidine1409-2'-O)-methyltransferase